MVLSLDPDLPMVWRSPTEVQIGIEKPRARVAVGSAHEEFALDLLRRGVSREGLESLLALRGAPPGTGDSVLARVAPALDGGSAALGSDRTAPGADRAPLVGRLAAPGRRTGLLGRRIAVDGRGVAAESVAALLQRCGAVLARAAECEESSTETVELAVLVSAFATAPRRSARWLRRDIPHLLVEFGDRSVRVGPVVVAGAGPCARCIEEGRLDDDAAWPAIAAQLADRAAPAADALGVAVAAPLVVQAAEEFLAMGETAWGRRALRWQHPLLGDAAAVPWVTVEEVRPHPACGCRSPTGSAMPAGRSPAADRSPPRRGADAVARG